MPIQLKKNCINKNLIKLKIATFNIDAITKSVIFYGCVWRLLISIS